jgi:ATP-dependent exoDNAse (exonuclease V) beta subunit
MTNQTIESLLPLIEDAREEQREAIMSGAPVIVLSAGAGAGKTHTLARRFAWLLASDPTCGVDQILTLTFTQLAASEMRERIRGTLKSWYRQRTMPHLRDAIERIDEAYISTLHSFALRVIRESGLDLEIDPGAPLISEPYSREFWRDFKWSLETMSGGVAKSGLTNDPSFVAFLNYYGAGLLASLAEESGEVFGSANMRPREIMAFQGRSEEAMAVRVTRRLSGEWNRVWDFWHDRVFPAIPGYFEGSKGKFATTMREFLARWREKEMSGGTALRFFVDLMCGPLSDLRGSGKLKELFTEEFCLDLSAWRDGLKPAAGVSEPLLSYPLYEEDEAKARELLSHVASTGWELWDAKRLEDGVLSFPDLVRYAGEALLQNPSYSLRFRHIMVDEFQDTDGLQDGMVRALQAAWKGSLDGQNEQDELKKPLPQRTLFMVGDIKQSIYRFRHANPELFAGYITGAEASRDGAVHIPLSCSYRMSGRLMERVNLVFSNLWEKGVMEIDGPVVRYEPLRPPTDAPWWEERNGPDAPRHPLEIILYNPGEGTDGAAELAPEKRRGLAEGIARRLISLVGGDGAEPAKIWDKGALALRPVSWRDITILVPTRTSYQSIEDAFENAGIPVVISRNMGYFNRGEVQDIVNLLRLLDMPDEGYALTCWLESPFSGVKPGTALALISRAREAGGSLRSLFGLFESSCPGEAERLISLRRTARLVGPAGALLSLLEAPSWLPAYSENARQRVLANLRKGVEIAMEYESSMGRSLPACADYLGHSMRGSAGTEEPDMSSEELDAVRVMTVHASKGLEFPVVLLVSDSDRLKKKGRARAMVSRTLGLVPARIPSMDGHGSLTSSKDKSVTAKWHEFIEAEEEKSEDERLMYVAMTRAQDYLICCGILNGPDVTDTGGWIAKIISAGAGNDDIFPVTVIGGDGEHGAARTAWPHGSLTSQKPNPNGREAQDANMFPCDTSLGNIRILPRLAKFSASAYSMISWCPLAYRRRYRQGIGLKWELPDGDGYGGADLGSLAHWVLTRWDLDPATLSEHLPSQEESDSDDIKKAQAEVPAYLRPTFSSARKRMALRSWLGDFAETDECGQLRALKSNGLLRQEIEFSVKLGETRLAGSMDLFWEDEDGCHVRDWKITREGGAPIELYEKQLYFYALACRTVHPDSKVDAGLIYLRPEGRLSDGKSGVFDVRDWDGLAKDVEASASAAVVGPFEPRQDRCGVCPFRSSCGRTGLV